MRRAAGEVTEGRDDIGGSEHRGKEARERELREKKYDGKGVLQSGV